METAQISALARFQEWFLFAFHTEKDALILMKLLSLFYTYWICVIRSVLHFLAIKRWLLQNLLWFGFEHGGFVHFSQRIEINNSDDTNYFLCFMHAWEGYLKAWNCHTVCSLKNAVDGGGRSGWCMEGLGEEKNG